MESDRALSRRALLRMLAGTAAAVMTAPVLAACGGESAPETNTPPAGGGTSSGGTTASPAGGGTPSGGATASPATGSASASPVAGGSLTVYSGRSEELVSPVVERFKAASGVDVDVRYGDTAELAAAILEEGKNSPADVLFAQDAGALGAIAREDLFAPLPDDILNQVESRFRSPEGLWVGVSGRARAVVYNTERRSEADIPSSILDFTDPAWKGRLGWAPSNGSFQAFVTALRVLRGEDTARAWLEGIKANEPAVFDGNSAIVRAVLDGEIDAGFVNHYYLHREIAEAGRDLPARNYIYRNGDPGALINVAGIGMLRTAKNQPQAVAFIQYLLDEEAQTYFAEETFEYPLIPGVPTNPDLVPLEEIQTPDLDLSNLADLEGTLALLRDVGVL